MNMSRDWKQYWTEIPALVEEAVSVLHYLRTDEIDRSRIFLPEVFPVFLEAPLVNPLNRLLQRLARELAPVLMGREWGR